MNEKDGKFVDKKGSLTDKLCPKCNKKTIKMQVWIKNDNLDDNVKYSCICCKHSWWLND